MASKKSDAPTPAIEEDEAPVIVAAVRSESVQPDSETVTITQTQVVDHTEAPAAEIDLEYEEVVEEFEGRATVITRYDVKASA